MVRNLLTMPHNVMAPVCNSNKPGAAVGCMPHQVIRCTTIFAGQMIRISIAAEAFRTAFPPIIGGTAYLTMSQREAGTPVAYMHCSAMDTFSLCTTRSISLRGKRSAAEVKERLLVIFEIQSRAIREGR